MSICSIVDNSPKGTDRNKDMTKSYYERNREIILAKRRVYYLENKAACKLRASEWQKENPDAARKHSKTYYDANRELVLEKKKAWREENPDYQKEWLDAHPNYFKEWMDAHPNYAHEKYLERKANAKKEGK